MLMQPNQPNQQVPPPAPPLQPIPQPTPQPEQNPYGFIMDDKPPKKSGSLFKLPGGGSKKTRIILLISGVFLLLIVGWMLISLISSGNKAQNEKLIGLAQGQTEIIRVAKIGSNSQSVRQTETRNLAVNTSVVIETNKNAITALLAANKKKVKEKQLNATANKKIDAELEVATSNNTFDDTFNTILKGLLSEHQKQIKDAYDSSSSKSEKETLQASYNTVTVLLK